MHDMLQRIVFATTTSTAHMVFPEGKAHKLTDWRARIARHIEPGAPRTRATSHMVICPILLIADADVSRNLHATSSLAHHAHAPHHAHQAQTRI